MKGDDRWVKAESKSIVKYEFRKSSTMNAYNLLKASLHFKVAGPFKDTYSKC